MMGKVPLQVHTKHQGPGVRAQALFSLRLERASDPAWMHLAGLAGGAKRPRGCARCGFGRSAWWRAGSWYGNPTFLLTAWDGIPEVAQAHMDEFFVAELPCCASK